MTSNSMFLHLRIGVFLSVILLTLAGCRAPAVLVEVKIDSEIEFSGQGKLRIGRLDSDKMQEIAVPADAEKLEFTLTASEAGTHRVWVELIDGEVIARGHKNILFSADQVLETVILLTIPCTQDAQCDDEIFCNGIGLCQEGNCVRSTPCESPVSCVEYECNEELRECLPTVDHESCNEGFTDDDPQYCDPSQGCRPGLSCMVPNDCEDSINCIGEFDCVNFRCVYLGQPNPNDDNECTVDFCQISLGVVNRPKVDGEGCIAIEGGICVAGVCGASFCGDGYADPVARGQKPAEECDQGAANSDSNPDACRENCMLASCGDGVKDRYEECDDGNLEDDDACKNNCTLSVCGDGVKSINEECDDGDDDNNDGCRTDCIENKCGDGIQNFDVEACDDGNRNPNDGCYLCQRTEWEISVPFGYGEGQGNPRETALAVPFVLALDNGGNVYMAEATSSVIRRFDVTAKKISRVAGDGSFSGGGDGRLATQTDASAVASMTVDGVGNVFYADSGGNRVRRIDARTGIVTTIAGTGRSGYSGDGQLGTLAKLNLPQSLAVDGIGNVYIADTANRRVRRVDVTTGVITTVLGDGTADEELRDLPIGVSRDAVKSASPSPTYIALDGNQYLMVYDSINDNIYKVDLYTGKIRRWAGLFTSSNEQIGIIGPLANLGPLVNFTVGDDHAVYFSHKTDHSIRRIAPGDSAGGAISRIACNSSEPAFSGDHWESAATAECSKVTDLAVSSTGSILIADAGNMRVREIKYSDSMEEWQINTVMGRDEIIGTDVETFGLDAINYMFRQFPGRIGITLPDGEQTPDVFIALEDQNKILLRRSSDRNVITYAGTGQRGYFGDGGFAVDAALNQPVAMAVDQFTNIGVSYIVDRGNNAIRKVDENGIITTIIGTGTPGNNAPALNGGEQLGVDAMLNFPSSIGVDGMGRVWISDSLNNRIRRWDPVTGLISTIIEDADAPWGIVVVPFQFFLPEESTQEGSLLIYAKRGSHQIRFFAEFKLSENGSFTTIDRLIAGSGNAGYQDNVVGAQALLEYPRAMIPFIGPGCELCFLVADGFDRVRQLDITLNLPTGVSASVSTRLGGAFAEGSGIFDEAYMISPQHLVPIDQEGGRWLATDNVNGTLNYIDFNSPNKVQVVAGFPEGFESGDLSLVPTYTKKFAGAGQLVFDNSVSPPVVYVAESKDHIIRKLTISSPTGFSDWTVESFAGTLRTPGFSSDNTSIESALFSEPVGLALDTENRVLFVAERGSHIVRAIWLDAPGTPVTTVAGTAEYLGYYGDGLLAVEASLNAPSALAYGNNRLYIADTGNNRVRYVDNPLQEGAIINTLVGDGSPASSGEGPVASRFPVDHPLGLHLDRYGNLFISSRSAVRIINAGSDGLAGENDVTRLIFGGGARDRYPEPITRCISGLHTSVDGGRLYFFDACQGFMVQLERNVLQ